MTDTDTGMAALLETMTATIDWLAYTQAQAQAQADAKARIEGSSAPVPPITLELKWPISIATGVVKLFIQQFTNMTDLGWRQGRLKVVHLCGSLQ